MILRLLAGAMALAFFMLPAQARPHHHNHSSHHHVFIEGAPVHCDDRYPATCDRRGWQESHAHGPAVMFVGRPRDCYGIPWCGCWLRHAFGITDRAYNLAIRWARAGEAATPDTANVVVWRHHVGRLLEHRGALILVQSGNDGGAVRTRWRSTAGVVAWRRV